MRILVILPLLALATAAQARPVSGSMVRDADKTVSDRRVSLTHAAQTGDPAAIAAERAALKAAQAQAWAARHPAPAPTVVSYTPR